MKPDSSISPGPFLVLAAVIWVSAAYGCAPDREPTAAAVEPAGEPADPPAGRWHPLPVDSPDLSLSQRQALGRLQALPYLAGSNPAPAAAGVVLADPQRVQPGINLYNSGHAPEALAIDSKGDILHRWQFSIDRLWPDAGGHQSTFWRRVTWLPDGGVLAIFEGIGLIRLDRRSQLKWSYRAPIHHQAVIDLDGTILTLSRHPRVIPRLNPDSPVLEEFLVRLTPEGKRLEEISLLDAFENSRYRNLLEGARREGDFFHTNSIEVLDGSAESRLPEWKRGNLLLSMYFLDTVCVLDPRRKQIVWALRGDEGPTFRGQHDPRWLSGGRLLLFDNWGRSGKSRAVEFDLLNGEVAWQYPTDPESDFATPTCGTAQRLENGNTLLTASDQGRAVEVTREGEVVWEFLNPHRAGARSELIATLFEVRRVPADYLKK